MVFSVTCEQLILDLYNDKLIHSILINSAYKNLSFKNFTHRNINYFFKKYKIIVFKERISFDKIKKSETYKKIFNELKFPLKKENFIFKFLNIHTLKKKRSQIIHLDTLNFENYDFRYLYTQYNFYAYLKITGYTNPEFCDMFTFQIIVFSK